MQAPTPPSILPPSFLKLSTAVVDHVGQLYQQKNPACAVKKNQQSFYKFISGYNFELAQSSFSPYVKSTFNVTGFDILEDQNYVVDLGGESNSWLDLRTSFSFLYSLGGVSRYNNMNERLAAAVTAHLYLVNQSVLALMKQLQGEMTNPAKRFAREISMEAGGTGNSGKGTFDTETYLDTYNRLITSISNLVLIFGQEEVDLQQAAELSELLGFDEPAGLEAEGVSGDEEGVGLTGDAVDIVFIMQTLLKLREHQFTLRDGNGNDTDMTELELMVLRGAIEETFDETVDEHHFRPSVVLDKVNQMLFNFYTVFWRNYLGNILPLILMSFLNFTHAMSVFDAMLDLPF